MMRWLGLTLVLLLALSGCGDAVKRLKEKVAESQKAKKAALEAAAPKPEQVLIPVEITLPARRTLSTYMEPIGAVTAERRVEVVSKGMGQCLSVQAEVGDVVKEGQVLAELDREELLAQIKQTRVTVEQNRYMYNLSKDESDNGVLTAASNVDLKRFTLEQAEAALELQQVQLKHQTITAPISGVVASRRIQKGMMVSASLPVYTIVDPTSYMLPIHPHERELPRLISGQTAKVRIDSLDNREFEAQVRRVSPIVDSQNGTVEVILDFKDEDKAVLREGAFARVRLLMEEHQNALTVPKDAVVSDQARKCVMVVRHAAETAAVPAEGVSEGGTEGEAPPKPEWVAERVEVQVGLEDSSFVEITQGLTEADQVVVLGQHTLKPGAGVKVTTSKQEFTTLEGEKTGEGESR